MKYIISILLIFSQIAQANDSAAAAATVLLLFGAARGAEYSIHTGRWPDEIGDWKSPQTQITAEIVEQCNFLVEGRLLSTNRKNIMMLITKNLDKEVKLKPQDIEFEFESGIVRRGDVDLDTEYTVKKDGKYIMLIPFPRKDDFFNQNRITVSIPFKSENKSCNAKLIFNRPVEVPHLISTSTRLTTLETEFSIGTTGSSGNLKKYVGSNNSVIRLDLNFLGPKGHGVYLGIGVNGENNLTQQDTVNTGTVATSPIATLSSFNIGYIHRSILTRRSFIHYKLGADFSSLLITDNVDGSLRESYKGKGLHFQSLYHYTFAQIDRGIWRGDWAYAVGLDGRHIFDGEFKGDANFEGSQLGILATINIGY